MPPSEGRLGVDGTVLFAKHHDQLGLGYFELGFDLRRSLGSMQAFSSARSSSMCYSIIVISLLFEKDDARRRGGGSGSRIAHATANGGDWGSRNAPLFGGTIRP
ncbi:hypothetical protein [Rhizobium leguminosarum]|uniref:hypothetical protein n=1 Tax=Rhizobium leguminosarum TaxID=384 RepID=UPI001441B03E|nr:hypothetical protein [Rhizobium leguminosarum]MBY5869285.1 hypothetical protein [Rhizobium leguminosarum]